MDTVVAAGLGALAPTLMAALAWRKGQQTGAAVGETNGRGTVTQMLEFICDRVERLERRLDRLEDSHYGDGR